MRLADSAAWMSHTGVETASAADWDQYSSRASRSDLAASGPGAREPRELDRPAQTAHDAEQRDDFGVVGQPLPDGLVEVPHLAAGRGQLAKRLRSWLGLDRRRERQVCRTSWASRLLNLPSAKVSPGVDHLTW
jgi:hypothetical protein